MQYFISMWLIKYISFKLRKSFQLRIIPLNLLLFSTLLIRLIAAR